MSAWVRGWRLTPLRLAALLAFGCALVRLGGCHYVDLLDTRAVDFRFRERGPQPPLPEIVIVAIDDASVAQLGRWPWSRAIVAKLLDRIMAAAPAVVGFDIVQSEATEAPRIDGLRERLKDLDAHTLETVEQALATGGQEDAALAESVQRSGRTVLGYFFESPLEFGPARVDDSGEPPVRTSTYSVVRPSKRGRGEYLVPLARGARGNLPALTEAAREVGYFNFIPDEDGVYRRVPLAIRYRGEFALPLSFAMLRLFAPAATQSLRFTDVGVETLRVGPVDVPVAADGAMLLNFRGPGQTFPHIAAADLLAGKVAPEKLHGKLVLVGVTAAALFDVRATPFDPMMPGVEMHANVLDNVLRSDFLRAPAGLVFAAELMALPVSMLALGWALQYARGIRGAAVTVVLLTAYVGGGQWLFRVHGLVLSAAYPLLALSLTYAVISIQHYVAVERERRERQRALELYLSPKLALLLSDHPEMLKLGGEKRDQTVLFSDIRGFTTISEGLEPEALVELLNEYLGEMTEVVFEHEGMLDKYIGDAIMAVWGAPLAQMDHARRACLAALRMRERLQELYPTWRNRGWPLLEIGVGLNSGPMVFGNMGSAQHLSLTVIGDNVNLGSRLEGLTKYYGSRIVASETTVQAAGDAIVVRELDLVRVKGKALPVRIFEVLGVGDSGTRWTGLIDAFAAGLAAYRARRWAEARDVFSTILQGQPGDGPATLYRKRCDDMIKTPPSPDWDGVTVMEAK